MREWGRQAQLAQMQRVFRRAVQRGDLIAALRYCYWQGYAAGYYDMSHGKPVRTPAQRPSPKPHPAHPTLF